MGVVMTTAHQPHAFMSPCGKKVYPSTFSYTYDLGLEFPA